MSRFVPKAAKIGLRVKLNSPALVADGFTYADIIAVHGDNQVTAKLIHATDANNRPDIRLDATDYMFVAGKPRFPHVDGPAKGYAGAAADGGEGADGTGDDADGEEFSGDETEGYEAKPKSDGKAQGNANAQSEAPAPDAAKNPLLEQLEDFVLDVVAEAMVQSPMDETIVRKIAAEEAAKVKGGSVVVKVKDLPPVKVDGLAHAALQRVVTLVAAGVAKRNVALVGPAGCGKTTLSSQVKQALSLPSLAIVNGNPAMSKSELIGRSTPKLTGDDASVYESTPMVDAYVDGGLILIDEMDNMDPSMLTILNSALDNGFITLPNGETARRHPDTVVIVSMNTFGHGADRIYVGRNQLDGATLDRFTGSTLELDYDRALETKLCPEENIRKAVWEIRDKARAAKLRRIVSTRFLMSVRTLHLGVGDSLKAALRACATGWTEGDLKVVGLA